jgi:hypothetical protein
MDAADFAKTWHDLMAEKMRLFDQRTGLETELFEVRKKISHLTEVIDNLAPLAGLGYTSDGDLSQLGLTDAMRSVLKNSDERLSAQDLRRLLVEKGYDLSGLSAPMASIYKILSRLTEDPGEVEREKEEGRVYYRWKQETSGPLTDEDIPF